VASHKNAGAGITLTTTLPSDQLAAICKQAADECKAKLDGAKPGELTFSFRGSRTHLMTFKVRLSEGKDGKRQLVSAITHYKTKQPMFLFVIPAGTKQMLRLRSYERFMTRVSELARQADPDALVAISD
jgi:hypothetical protein